jgi:hypothetical protein
MEAAMNKGRMVGGIICLAIAGLLGVLYFTLPEENMMFMLGDEYLPWVPAVVLAIVGIVLVATAYRVSETAQETPVIVIDESKSALNKRLEAIGWGFFLVMLGGFMLVPQELVNKGYWSIGVGLIMLGLNAARYFNKIRMSGFTTFLGIVSLISGVAQILGYQEIGGALFLIILGAYLILKPWFDKRQLFGKAEQA